MARELKGYARKRMLGLVPSLYPANMRGVQPRPDDGEIARESNAARRRAWLNNPWRAVEPGERGSDAAA